MTTLEYIRAERSDYERKIEEFKVENSIMWKSLLDIAYRCNSIEEVQERTRKVFAELDDINPFTQHLKALEVKEKAAEVKEETAA